MPDAALVAVPLAGLVMLYGLPTSLLAGAVPFVAPVVMAPVGVGVRWIDAVATVGAALEPGPPWSWLGWAGPARRRGGDRAPKSSSDATMAARWRSTS